MAVKAPGDYDPNTGWPPDDSTGVNWQNDVDLPGQFGPGGFRASPKLTAPASGPPPGMSLPTPTNAAGMGPHIDPTTGQPEMLTGPGGIAEKTAGGFNPLSLLGGGNPYWRGAIAAGGVMTPTPAETGEFNPAMVTGRPDAPMGGVHGLPAAAPATYPHMPWPDTGAAPGVGSAAPAVPPPRPSPAVARQRPNLGAYAAPPPAAVANSPFTTFDRPNMSPQNSMQGRQGAPQMGMLDLSRLFGGGQPAPAAAPAPASILARPDLTQRVPLAQTPLPPRKTVKSSSTSQGGGY